MKHNQYKCIEFDDNSKELRIVIGTQGIIPYNEIEKVSILNEDAKFRGKSVPFSHQVLGGDNFLYLFWRTWIVCRLENCIER